MNQMGNNCVVAVTFQILIASMECQGSRKNTPKKNAPRKIASQKIDSHDLFCKFLISICYFLWQFSSVSKIYFHSVYFFDYK